MNKGPITGVGILILRNGMEALFGKRKGAQGGIHRITIKIKNQTRRTSRVLFTLILLEAKLLVVVFLERVVIVS